MAPRGLVIVGGGQAGFQVAASARTGGYQEPITIVAAERHLPYQRPPLSKAYLLGKQSADSLWLQKPAFFEKNRIEVLIGETVTTIDRAAGSVALANGRTLPYDDLVLATGARNRQLQTAGAELDGIMGLRSLADADELSGRVGAATDIVVIGGGLIGLEFAAVACALGKRVTVIEAQSRLMARAVPEAISTFFRTTHEQRGVAFVMSASVEAFVGEGGRVRVVRLSNGTSYPADLVVFGIGVHPNDEIGERAGLRVANGIAVDSNLRTSDPRVFAIGDCASFPTPDRRSHRIESVQNAIDQGRYVAQAIAGEMSPYAAVPWFWSDQYDIKLQIAGLSGGADDVVLRGDPASGRFSAFSFRNGKLLAVDSVNQAIDHATARKMLGAECPLSPQEAADLDLDLRQIARDRCGQAERVT